MSDTTSPTSFAEVAAALRVASAEARAVRVIGAGTKSHPSKPEPPDGALVLKTTGLDQPIEHDPADGFAVIAAGVPLSRARSELAAAGRLLALDPPLGPPGGQAATIGGVIATADSGPISHRYGAAREQLTGIVAALPDGTIARAGSRLARSVAGYDLVSLYTGSRGTLGVILAVSFRLHRLPEATATALGTASDAVQLLDAARRLHAAIPELQALDIAWRGGRGGLLAQTAGPQPQGAAGRAARAMRVAGLSGVDVVDDDGGLWARQRAGQRSKTGRTVVVRVAAGANLPALLKHADTCDATVIARAVRGTAYVELAPDELPALNAALPDAPAGASALQRAVKKALDPTATFPPLQ